MYLHFNSRWGEFTSGNKIMFILVDFLLLSSTNHMISTHSKYVQMPALYHSAWNNNMSDYWLI